MTFDERDLYLNIINDYPEGVYCVDENRRIFFWSDGAMRITGYTSGEMIGKACYESGLDHIDAEGRHICNLMCPPRASPRHDLSVPAERPHRRRNRNIP